MNLYNIIQNILDTSKSHRLVKEVGEGDIYQYLNSGEHQYPCVFLTISSVNDTDTSRNVNGTLFYVDRLTSDFSNKVSVQSLGITILGDILGAIEGDLDSVDYTVFTEKFTDLCGGVYATLNITYPFDELCGGDFEIRELEVTSNGVYDTIGYDKVVVAVVDRESLEKIEELQTQVEEKDNQIEDLESQITSKQSQIDTLTAEKEELQSQVDEKNTQIEELESQITSKQSQINTLTAEKTNLESQIAQKDSQIADLNSEISTLTSEKESLLSEKQDLQSQINEQNVRIESMQEEIDSLNGDVTNLQNELGSISTITITENGTYSTNFNEDVENPENNTPAGWNNIIVNVEGSGDSSNFVLDNGTKLAYSTWSEVPSKYDFSEITNFSYMFNRCTNLTNVPQINSSKGTNFSNMFANCSNLTTIPLIDTSIGIDFSNMFYICSNLTDVPQIDTSNGVSFIYMFYNCRNITDIPQIDTSNGDSFAGMFYSCSNLENITFVGSINANIDFSPCTKLTYNSVLSILTACSNTTKPTISKTLKFNRTLTDQNGELQSLVDICTSKGWTISGLTLIVPDDANYFYIESLEDDNAVTIDDSRIGRYRSSVAYSTDKENWITPAANLTLNSGDKVYFKYVGDSNLESLKYINDGSTAITNGVPLLNTSKSFNVGGDISTVIYGEENVTSMTNDGALYELFANTYVKDASQLILPATTLTDSCYWNMFYNCSLLTTAPDLPAPILVEDCYNSMFFNCPNLSYIKCLATNPPSLLSGEGTNSWTYGVSSTGTFVKHPDANWITNSGITYKGIPNGWTVVDAEI